MNPLLTGDCSRAAVEQRSSQSGATEFPSRKYNVSVNITSLADFALTAVDTHRGLDLDNLHISASELPSFLGVTAFSSKFVCGKVRALLLIEATGPERLTGAEAEHAATNRSIRRKNI